MLPPMGPGYETALQQRGAISPLAAKSWYWLYSQFAAFCSDASVSGSCKKSNFPSGPFSRSISAWTVDIIFHTSLVLAFHKMYGTCTSISSTTSASNSPFFRGVQRHLLSIWVTRTQHLSGGSSSGAAVISIKSVLDCGSCEKWSFITSSLGKKGRGR